jgi:hypothetical protein
MVSPPKKISPVGERLRCFPCLVAPTAEPMLAQALKLKALSL